MPKLALLGFRQRVRTHAESSNTHTHTHTHTHDSMMCGRTVERRSKRRTSAAVAIDQAG